jgi:hypothetical protein
VSPDHHIAQQLNAEGMTTRTGKPWTYQRVYSVRKQHHIPSACPLTTSEGEARGDGLVPVTVAAQLLHVSPSLINGWAKQGVLCKDQRVAASKLWVRVNDSDIARLNGSVNSQQWPTIDHIVTHNSNR